MFVQPQKVDKINSFKRDKSHKSQSKAQNKYFTKSLQKILSSWFQAMTLKALSEDRIKCKIRASGNSQEGILSSKVTLLKQYCFNNISLQIQRAEINNRKQLLIRPYLPRIHRWKLEKNCFTRKIGRSKASERLLWLPYCLSPQYALVLIKKRYKELSFILKRNNWQKNLNSWKCCLFLSL